MSTITAPALLRDEAGTVAVADVRALVVRYLVASTLTFFVGGSLGVLLRQSQAQVEVLKPALWYQLMTAHGLAAFVGWAAFALMGISFWVLQEVGFEITRTGYRLALACWWTMVVGVVGIVITCMALGFAGSWVFLYPLPLASAGAWSPLGGALFSAAVLSVGVSILTWCAGILAVTCGPSLGARSRSPLNRLGCAIGLGFVWPRRFATERPVPYPVIPLAVIAIDMIIATLPLAVLLVEMIVQAAHPGTTIDPLLAKSMLWWFGHPVVYLLLFPAVALYYHLIPRYAGRSLVAGPVIGIAWLIGVVSNVFIGAHHMYTDFPTSFQQTVDTGMQPLTYAVTIPSALSLFSLGFTIYRSEFQWTPASRFLCVALVSWLVAGLQGVELATIQYDQVAHNTLWIVGHFHNMALLNIGLVIFGGIYAYVPALIGREWASTRLADWHLALTVIGGYGSVVPWMLQGLEGAPRRFAVLPHQYLTMSKLALPFVGLIVVGQVLFAVNAIRTLRPWLQTQVARPPADTAIVARERPTEALGGLLAAVGIALSLACLWSKPFLWAPIGILLGYVAVTMNARRQGLATMGWALVLLVLGLLVGG